MNDDYDDDLDPRVTNYVLDNGESEYLFSVWPKDGTEADARHYRAGHVKQAAEARAYDDAKASGEKRAARYCARNEYDGRLWAVLVGIVSEPSFVAVEAGEIPMLPATHVLWGGDALCGDRRLRHVPRDWPAGQRWISLKDVADGAEAPADRCEACWNKVPGLVDGIRQIGMRR